MSTRPSIDEICFPIAKDELKFNAGKGFKGEKFIRSMPIPEKIKFEKIRPYKGGHPYLWALHRLDIQRKHKTLLNITVLAPNWSVMAWTRTGLDQIVPVGMQIESNGETVLAFVPKNFQGQIKVTPIVTIQENDLKSPYPANTLLRQFVAATREIISNFSLD